MSKAPRAGQVKTRLTPPLTSEEAAELNICFLRDTTAAIASAIHENQAHGIVVYTPVGQERIYANILPPDFALMAQRGQLLDRRLISATQDLLGVGFASVCLIGSDAPTVPLSAYADAVRFLATPGERIVLGPSDDGGYYLIGMKQLHRRLFEGIAWSTARVLQETLERAAELRLEVKLLPACFDVDDRANLQRLCEELLGRDRKPAHDPAPSTRQFLEGIVAREGRVRIWPNES